MLIYRRLIKQLKIMERPKFCDLCVQHRVSQLVCQNNFADMRGYDASKRLTGIRYSDLGGANAHTVYSYGTAGGYQLLTRMRNYDGIAVNIEYDSSRRVAALENVALVAGDAVGRFGGKQIFDYRNMETHVTSVETASNNSGKTLYYQFNDSGNVVSAHDDLGFGSFTKFESGIENKLSQSSRLRKAVVNLLRKPDWTSGWSNNRNGSSI